MRPTLAYWAGWLALWLVTVPPLLYLLYQILQELRRP
jgi:hypothetical protein